MTKYLITFPSEAMRLNEDEVARASVDAHEVIEQAKTAGVYVFGGGINESVNPVLVAADGSVSLDIYQGRKLNGGLPSWNCQRDRVRRNGRGESRSPATARKGFGRSCTTPQASLSRRGSRHHVEDT